jgi:ribonuclease HI
MDEIVRIFTDGSAIGNPGPGGWGAVFIQGNKRWEMSGANPWTTIAEMELAAAIHALRSMPTGARIELLSDSEYLILGMSSLVFRWQSQGWRNRRGAAVRHRALWIELILLDAQLHIQWGWVKGHNGHPIQSRADALAYQAARTLWIAQNVAA